jgi:hypothetical protein
LGQTAGGSVPSVVILQHARTFVAGGAIRRDGGIATMKAVY